MCLSFVLISVLNVQVVHVISVMLGTFSTLILMNAKNALATVRHAAWPQSTSALRVSRVSIWIRQLTHVRSVIVVALPALGPLRHNAVHVPLDREWAAVSANSALETVKAVIHPVCAQSASLALLWCNLLEFAEDVPYPAQAVTPMTLDSAPIVLLAFI